MDNLSAGGSLALIGFLGLVALITLAAAPPDLGFSQRVVATDRRGPRSGLIDALTTWGVVESLVKG